MMSIVKDLNDYYLFEIGMFKLNFQDFDIISLITQSYNLYI